jgi:YD repeat-containing protein
VNIDFFTGWVAQSKLVWAIVLSSFLLFVASAPALAQGVVGLSPEGPPVYSEREFGINLSTTDMQFQNNDISVGSGEFPTKLTLTRTYNAIGYPFRNMGSINIQNQYTGFGQGSSHSLLAYFTRRSCTTSSNSRIISLTAVVFGRSYHFSGGGCIQSGPSILVSNDDEGATMRIVDPSQSTWTYELLTREGVKVLFTDSSAYHYDTYGGRYATVAEFPNGDFIGFTYSASPSVSGAVRPTTVYNSRGYGLSFNYKTRGQYFPGSTLTDSSLITSVTSYKKTASATVNLASVNYTYDLSNLVVVSFQNAVNGIYRYTYSEGRPTGIFLPQNGTSLPSTSISYFDGISQVTSATVSKANPGVGFPLTLPPGDNERDISWSVPMSVKDAVGNVTQFRFSDPTAREPITVSVIKPDGSSRGYATVFCDTSPACSLAPYFNRMPSDFGDENGRIWRYKYDNHGRPLSTTNPEGAVNTLARDANGNITQIRNQPKPGSSVPDILSSAGYTPCTSVNYKYCNQPIYTIDPNGGRWDFNYDSGGGLAVSLAPADASGVRAVTRYTYTAFGYGPVALPPLLAPSTIRLLTAKDTCRSSSVPANTIDFSFVCPLAERIREVYSFAPTTVTLPSSLELVGVRPDADNNAVSTLMTYDNLGNVTSSTDLLGNTTFATYDALRRKIFEIGNDPDGGGPLLRQIVRHVYDGNSNEIRTETGTGSLANGTDFTILRYTRRTFDLNDQLIRTEEVTP